MNQEANQVTLLKFIKNEMKRHLNIFNSFSVLSEDITTNTLGHKCNRLVVSDQYCWEAMSNYFIIKFPK